MKKLAELINFLNLNKPNYIAEYHDFNMIEFKILSEVSIIYEKGEISLRGVVIKNIDELYLSL